MSILDTLQANSFNMIDLMIFCGMGIAIGIDIGLAIAAIKRKRKAKDTINKLYGYFTYADRVYVDTDSIKATK